MSRRMRFSVLILVLLLAWPVGLTRALDPSAPSLEVPMEVFVCLGNVIRQNEYVLAEELEELAEVDDWEADLGLPRSSREERIERKGQSNPEAKPYLARYEPLHVR